jgi:hypothetical protein
MAAIPIPTSCKVLDHLLEAVLLFLAAPRDSLAASLARAVPIGSGNTGRGRWKPDDRSGDLLEDHRPLALLLRPSSKAMSCPDRRGATPDLQSRKLLR